MRVLYIKKVLNVCIHKFYISAQEPTNSKKSMGFFWKHEHLKVYAFI